MSVQDLERCLEEPISVLKRFLDQLPKDGQNKICNEALLPVLNSFINQKLGFIRLPDCACNSHPTVFKRNFLDPANHRNGESVDITKILSTASNLESDSDLRFNFLKDPEKSVELLSRLPLMERATISHRLLQIAIVNLNENDLWKKLSPFDSFATTSVANSLASEDPFSKPIELVNTQSDRAYDLLVQLLQRLSSENKREVALPLIKVALKYYKEKHLSPDDSSSEKNRETNLPVRSGISDSDRRDESSESSNGGMPGGGKKTFQKLIEQHLISKRNLPAQQPVLPSSSTDGISGVSSSSKSIQDYRAPALPEARDAKINDHYSRNSMAHSSFKLSEHPYQRPNNSAEPKFEPSAISMYADRADRAANPRFDKYENVQSQKQQQQQQQQNQQPSSLDIANESATIKEACNFVIQCDDDWAKADAGAPNLEADFHSSSKPFDNAAQENIQPQQQQQQQPQQRQSRNSEHTTDMDTRSGGASDDEKSNHNIDFGRSAHRRSSSLRSTESDSYAHAMPPSEVSSSRNQLRESLNSYRRNATEPGSPKSVLSGGGGSLASSNAQKIDESLRSSQAAAATSESRTPSESASQTSVPIHDSQQQQQQQPQQRQPPQRASNGHLSMVEAFKNRNSMMMADRNKNSLDGDNNYQNFNPNKQNNNRNNRYDSNSSNQSQQPGDHRNATWQSKPKIGSEHQAPESPPFDRSAIPDDFDWTS